MSSLIRIVHYLDLESYKGPRSNHNMPIEIPCVTSDLKSIIMLVKSVTISKIFAVEIVRHHDLDLWNGSRSNANMLIEIPYATSYLMEIVFSPCFFQNFQDIHCRNVHDRDLGL